ncbi:MAG TPA: peptide chain release factor 2 [Clostridiales bacterium]|nr:peptide chain release factor 2 [Clostridiales bacterium]
MCAVSVFDLDNLNKRVKFLAEQLEQKEVYTNLSLSTSYNVELKHKSDELDNYNKLKDEAEFLSFAIDEVKDEDSTNLEYINAQLEELSKKTDKLYLETLLNGKYDSNNAIVKIHSGAGGTEACDWVSMLYRMYTMWAKNSGFQVQLIDSLDGDGAGLKNVTFMVNGYNAYGYLKSEIGVHRLVRISPFDANKRRHTSFASVEVMPDVEDDTSVYVNPDDIRIDTYRSSGAGGQHVNKTDSAIRITHFPTGIVVTCQNERSQIQNRETAMKLLVAKLVSLKEEENRQEALKLKGDSKKIEWGSQIRSYVFCPYTMVSDHRTGLKLTDVMAVMDGKIDELILEYLKWEKS